MVNETANATTKISKKQLRHLVENKIAESVAEIITVNGNTAKLQKKIKKAGKLIMPELSVLLKAEKKKAMKQDIE
ncbi:MAG: hypothetical protein ABI594_15555 [Ginsengibacter sp.]